jgi:iron complex transport system ATP-binding protein
MNPVLAAYNLQFAYGKAPPAVRNVSLSAPQRSLTAIIGANGSGKSTLIRMLAGLLDPASGRIVLDGAPLHSWAPRERARKIAYVPQTTALVFPFQAIEVVLSGRAPHVDRFRFEGAADRERAIEALATVGGAHLALRRVTDLSGGERQMVILARAIAQEPRILLLDEPSASLDLKHRAALIRTLARLREERGVSAIMVTHDLQLIASSFDRILALHEGEMVREGTPDEVLDSALLSRIYEDPGVRAHRIGNQTFVWTEL